MTLFVRLEAALELCEAVGNCNVPVRISDLKALIEMAKRATEQRQQTKDAAT